MHAWQYKFPKPLVCDMSSNMKAIFQIHHPRDSNEGKDVNLSFKSDISLWLFKKSTKDFIRKRIPSAFQTLVLSFQPLSHTHILNLH